MTRRPSTPRFPASLARAASAGRPSDTDLVRPQRMLHEAVREAARQAPPSGLGLDSAAVRERMVQRLHAQGLQHPAVLRALANVPRHQFVDTALAGQAYEDTSLPIGLGQTISKPSIVARMLALLFDGRKARETGTLGRVLEIGTGCGYQTALLAELGTSVVSLERLGALHHKARANLAPMRGHRVRLVHGDGRLGHAPLAPYDSIVAAAGGDDLPPAWVEQLAEGGRLVAPMWNGASQVLVVLDKHDGAVRRQVCEAVHFVPLKSGTG